MPTTPDYVFVFVAVVLLSIAEYTFFWPRFRAAVASGKTDARTWGYKRGIALQWLLTAAALLIFSSQGRSPLLLGLTAPRGWRLAVGIMLVILTGLLSCLQLRSVARLDAKRRRGIMNRMNDVVFILPHTRTEYAWFLILSFTAGICEELLCRGYLTWFFASGFGRYGAYGIVIILFGLGHAYQGRSGIVKTAIAGAVLTAVCVVTGSLLPGMFVHTIIDAGSGTLGYRLLRDEHPAPP